MPEQQDELTQKDFEYKMKYIDKDGKKGVMKVTGIKSHTIMQDGPRRTDITQRWGRDGVYHGLRVVDGTDGDLHSLERCCTPGSTADAILATILARHQAS